MLKKIIHWGGGAVTKGVCGASPSDRRQVTQNKKLVTCKRCKARIRSLKKKATRKSKSETVEGQRKYHRGGRVEAYTMGEAMGSKKWP